MRILVGQLSPIVGDVRGNLTRCLDAVERARAAGVQLLVLPELVLCGYPPRDLLERTDLLDSCARATEQLVAASGGLVVVFGAPLRDERGLRNAAVVASDGQRVAVVPKTLLPTYDVFDERRHFVPGEGSEPVRVGGVTLGVTVCEDLWMDEGVGLEQAETGIRKDQSYGVDPVDGLGGCDLVLNLSASPFHAQKRDLRLELLRRQARRLGAPVVYCNMVGGNDELLFDGQSLVVRPDGQALAVGPSCREAWIEVDLAGDPVPVPHRCWEEEVHDALVMGIRDYAHRCGFRTALLGLSGGIDSAVVAVLAAEALGARQLLAVGMPGPFSSEGSVSDARALAEGLGVSFEQVPIGRIHQTFLDGLARLFVGRESDVAEENLQARERGAILMALSNKLGHLLLTTGNKSELAVGYCTLYGDMNGGLAVISDLFKTDVYRLARWLNRDQELIPQAILDKPPSAELAPDQCDQDSLPAYEDLDAILKLYVEGTVDPERIIAAGHPRERVERVVTLVVRSEYKRWQAAPGLRVSPRAFGTGRRIPLAQRWHHPHSKVG
ncbi:MAG: NAD+ synthase [Myxococcota bacterium]|nr:NAD+ synthase [Myxococcota bacterium]